MKKYIKSNRRIMWIQIKTMRWIIFLSIISLFLSIHSAYLNIKKSNQINKLQKAIELRDSIYPLAIKIANQKTKELDTINNNYYLVNKNEIKLINYVKSRSSISKPQRR